MAKQAYTALTEECWSEVIEKKTIFTKPKLFPAAENFFQKFLDEKTSKIAVNIQDRTAGKGDRAVVVYYNFDLSQWYELAWKGAVAIGMEGKFSKNYSKIYGDTLETVGQYQGMCPAIHCNVYRSQVDRTGQQMRSPWRITIENGYARRSPGKIAGAWYETPKSFIATKSVSYNLTDQSLFNCFVTVAMAITETTHLFAGRLAKGRDAFAQLRTQGSHTQAMPYAAQPVAQATTQPQPVAQAQPSAQAQAYGREYQVVLSREILTDEHGQKVIARFESDGKERSLYFPKGFPNDLDAARRNGYPIMVPVAVSGDRRCIYAR